MIRCLRSLAEASCDRSLRSPALRRIGEFSNMNNGEADDMSELQDRTRSDEEAGYGAATDGDREDEPDQEQQTREPASEEEAEQNNYANTADDQA